MYISKVYVLTYCFL